MYVQVKNGQIMSNQITDENIEDIFTEEERKINGFYKVIETEPFLTEGQVSKLHSFVYNAEEDIVSTNWEILEDLPNLIETKLSFLSNIFKAKTSRPSFKSSLGFVVDAGKADLENYKIAKDLGFLECRDISGVNHTLTSEDWSTLILEIQTLGLELYRLKWAKEMEIKNPDITLKELEEMDLENTFNELLVYS